MPDASFIDSTVPFIDLHRHLDGSVRLETIVDLARQMIRLAPSELVQTPREESVDGKNVRITTLTRAPGIFANYTTWNFEIDGALVHRLDFELRAAN